MSDSSRSRRGGFTEAGQQRRHVYQTGDVEVCLSRKTRNPRVDFAVKGLFEKDGLDRFGREGGEDGEISLR